MSVQKGFESGCDCVFGVVAAMVVLVIALTMVAQFVTPCEECFCTGNCMLCGGSGKGILFGDCMHCDGKKKCPKCGGRGWKWK